MRYMFHVEGAEFDVREGGRPILLREDMVKGKKWFSLTADYAFGHDLLRVAKKFMEAMAVSLPPTISCRPTPTTSVPIS